MKNISFITKEDDLESKLRQMKEGKLGTPDASLIAKMIMEFSRRICFINKHTDGDERVVRKYQENIEYLQNLQA